ncbi:flagellar hook-basal body complex protein FliE [Jannaschia marina]|uniref:flagellar hook-basal body complex protein FliE n=1 Tax=Jannaschia marina TaxID=2741674 RepID=UPI0015CAEE41|nr:flagellar hook-basal body complex protein FliE [Jannaschia marina]
MDLSPIVAASGAGGSTAATPASRAMTGFAETLAAAERESIAAVTAGADPHAMVTAIAESKLAVDMVVAVRDRAVEAYQEVLRMPV